MHFQSTSVVIKQITTIATKSSVGWSRKTNE